MTRLSPIVAGFGSLVLSCGLLHAQERIPVPTVDRNPVRGSVQSAPRRPTIVVSEDTVRTPVGDGPEFAPTAEVPGGESNDPYRLAFIGGDYRPEPGLDPRLEQRLRLDPHGSSFALVMIEGRMTAPARLQALRDRGCRILGVQTWQSFVVELPNESMRAIETLPFVRWVGLPPAAHKIDPRLTARLLAVDPDQRLELVLSVHASDLGPDSVRSRQSGFEASAADPRSAQQPIEEVLPNGPIQRSLEAEGFGFGGYYEVGRVYTFRGHAPAAAVRRIAALNAVAFVEPYQMPVPLDDQTMAMVGLDRVRGAFGGNGVTAGIVDTGFQGGGNRHNDLNKFSVGWSNVAGGAFVDNDGHGTHVLGTLAGTGTVDQRYVGAAPDLGSEPSNRLFVGRLFDVTGAAQGDFRTLFNAMSTAFVDGNGVRSPKPRVINNSWGATAAGSGPGAYYTGTEAAPRFIDDLIYTGKQLHVFAAGNQGLGVTLQASAKNCLTVGAVHDIWDNATVGDTLGGAPNGTVDGRRKPELVAPGNLVTATSNLSKTGYATRGGSSPAAPHVTGALAGLLDHFPAELDLAPQALKAIVAASAQWRSDPDVSNSVLTRARGLGMLQAHRMHYTTDDSEAFWGLRSTPFTFSGAATSWDFTMPTDLTAVKVVLAWIEPAGYAGSRIARGNRLECWLDVEPFVQLPDVGDFQVPADGHQTLQALASNVLTAGGFAEAVAGKQVRVKVVGRSVLTEALPAVAIVAFTDETYTTGPTHALTVDQDAVQPGGQLTVEAELASPPGADEFENGRIDPDFAGFTVLAMERTTADGMLHSYVAGGPVWPSSPYPNLLDGMVIGAGTERSLRWSVQAPSSEGVFPLTTDAVSAPLPTPAQQTVQVCVDGTVPDPIAGLASSSHLAGVWSSTTDVDFTWDAATDQGCAGVQGIGYDWRQGGSAPPTGAGLIAQATFLLLPSADTATAADGYTLTLRVYDEARNESALVTAGPFLIDTQMPSTPSVQIAGGATHTGSLSVPVQMTASDPQSGVAEVRVSADGSTWSAWRSYPSGAITIDLSAFGGSAAEGSKQLFVEARDAAGNVSAAGSDSIEYLRVPSLGAPQVGTTRTVGPTPLVLAGSDLVGVRRVSFGGLVIDSQSPEDFADGWFEIIGDTRIEVHPPQGLDAGSYPIRVENRSGASNPRSVNLVFPVRPTLLTSPGLVAAGASQRWLTHHGGASGTIASYLVLSPLNTPSRLPGIVDLDLGGAFSVLFVVEPAALHDPMTGAAEFAPLPIPATLAGTTWYSQVMQVDLSNLAATPIPVTNLETTIYR